MHFLLHCSHLTHLTQAYSVLAACHSHYYECATISFCLYSFYKTIFYYLVYYVLRRIFIRHIFYYKYKDKTKIIKKTSKLENFEVILFIKFLKLHNLLYYFSPAIFTKIIIIVTHPSIISA